MAGAGLGMTQKSHAIAWLFSGRLTYSTKLKQWV